MACFIRLISGVASAAVLLAAGCSTGPGDGDPDFVSDNPAGGGDGDGDGGTGASSGGEGDPGGDGDGDDGGDDGGERDISEADIIEIEGDRLYALSSLSGLAVIDVSTRDVLPVLGRYRAHAQPFEMYVDAGQVFVMYTDYGDYTWDDVVGGYVWRQTSRLVALDASDPADIQLTGEFDIPGRIQDSRRVGDVLYLVTHQDGYCWGCTETQNTTVTSLDVTDPTAVKLVDQVTFDAPQEGYGGWQRSVSATDERMYVAGPEWLADEPGRSTIDVVDISDPSGALRKGTSLVVAGQINSRWQMDEFEGVLRVVSQPDDWGMNQVPVVQTFMVSSADEITPLGRVDMRLPRPEQLRSVRFDGPRGYAITFERTDPLFTLDLSDAENPAQLGELEIPGWVYHMEPRGDRILGLGFDQGNENGSINVSLFDVSDFANPTMVERVHFGEGWANFAEDQDRIHKAFTVLEDQGLLLIPYEGWSYEDDDYCGAYRSAVQLVDFTEDSLTKRGHAPARGEARRAFLHDERLFSVGDKAVQTFDITDRDNPVSTSETALAINVNRSVVVGEQLVRVSASWWDSDTRLEVVPRSNAETADPTGVLILDDVLADDRTGFPEEGCGLWEIQGAELFAEGNHVYMVYESWNYEGEKGKTRIAVFDIANPAAPAFVQTVDLEIQLGWGGGWFGGLSLPARRIAKVGPTLVFSTRDYDYEGEEYRVRTGFEIVDLSDPSAPRHAGTVDRGEAMEFGGLIPSGEDVLSWHARDVSGDGSKVAFYLDRLELGDGGDAQVVSVNVPGAPLSYSKASGRAMTVDFQVEYLDVANEEECWSDPHMYSWDYDRKRCVLVHHDLALVSIDGERAKLLDRLDVEGELTLRQIAAGETRVFAELGPGFDWYGGGIGEDDVGGGAPDPEFRREVAVVTGIDGGDLEVAGTVDLGAGYSSYYGPAAVVGARLVLNLETGLGIIDATDAASPTLTVHELYGYGCGHLAEDGDRVHCSMGQYGLQTVPLAP